MASEGVTEEELDAKADELIKKYKTKIDKTIEELDSEGRLRSVYEGQLSIGIYPYFRKMILELEKETDDYLKPLRTKLSDDRFRDFYHKVLDGVKKEFEEALEQIKI